VSQWKFIAVWALLLLHSNQSGPVSHLESPHHTVVILTIATWLSFTTTEIWYCSWYCNWYCNITTENFSV